MANARGGARLGAGRPKGSLNRATRDVRELALEYGPAAMAELARLSVEAESESARIAARKEILDRAYGRPQAVQVRDDEQEETRVEWTWLDRVKALGMLRLSSGDNAYDLGGGDEEESDDDSAPLINPFEELPVPDFPMETLPPDVRDFVRLVGAVLLEQNDDWLTQNRYMQIEGMTEMASSAIDAQPLQITPKAACSMTTSGHYPNYTTLTDATAAASSSAPSFRTLSMSALPEPPTAFSSAPASVGTTSPDTWLHPGGAKVIDAAERVLELRAGALEASRHTLRNYGNMSSATALFVLKYALDNRRRGRHLLAAFGPGFSAYFVLLDL